jgi:hypothetical protein
MNPLAVQRGPGGRPGGAKATNAPVGGVGFTNLPEVRGLRVLRNNAPRPSVAVGDLLKFRWRGETSEASVGNVNNSYGTTHYRLNWIGDTTRTTMDADTLGSEIVSSWGHGASFSR